MLKRLRDEINARTGYRALLRKALEESIPGGARWRYVWGSALASTLLIQLVTGLLLMLSYSPSSSTAWGSVYYIHHDLGMGWFIRGIHHFGAQAMVVLLALHLVQVVVAGAYRSPREFNWWFGMALLVLTLGFGLTGYLLPWDQKGYWATKVSTNIMGGAPLIGPYLEEVVVGGRDYGNQSLTRFYGLHVGILPVVLFVCLSAHVALFRRHGVTAPRNAAGVGVFWPEQFFRDIAVAVTVFGLLIGLTVRQGGAPLDAPANPASTDYPARPEWYFLSLFQMLKLFPGKLEVIGAIVIPGAVLTVMLALPLLDRVLPLRRAHALACGFVFALLGGVGLLTLAALRDDARDRPFQAACRKAEQARDRALQLARLGIPPDGASYFLLRDPQWHGKDVLEARCLVCHAYGGQGRVSRDANGQETRSPQTASDLKNFGSRTWVRGLLEDPKSAFYFGKVPQCGGMARWKKRSKLSPRELDAVADFVGSFAGIPPDVTPAEWVNDPKVAKHPGVKPFAKECGQCHIVPGLTEGGNEDAPTLFAWGSPHWIARMIKKPGAHDLFDFLEKSDRMPSFDGQLTDNDLTTVIRFLEGEGLPRVGPAADRP